MYSHGLMSWTDIGLPDPDKGKAFYTQLFGWSAEDQFDDDGNYIYTMFSKGETTVAGMGPMPAEMQAAGVPPMWQSYATVDSVDGVVDKLTSAGGAVVVPAMDVMEAGRMAVVAEPNGAVLSLWQANNHVGAQVFNEHGAMTWNELNTRDSAASREFWSDVLGWTFNPMDTGGQMEYWVIQCHNDFASCAGDGANGGILTMDENWPPEVPPHWMVYFHVDNTDDTLAKLEELGGTVSVPAFDSSAGRMAVVNDDQGGTFSIIAPSQAAD